MQYKFGQWNILPTENKLINHISKEEIRIEPKSMAALKLFIESPDEVIGIEDFMQAIWNGRIVGDHAVYRAINPTQKKFKP